MTQTRKLNPDRFGWLEDLAVRDQLATVERLIAEVSSGGRDFNTARKLRAKVAVTPAAFHRQLLSPHSKRLRAALLLLVARFGTRQPTDQLVKAAAAIEQVHEATLYHDDIVDRSSVRRGDLSVQAAFGPSVAAFAGSELLYASARLCSAMPAAVREEIARTAAMLCQGQVREVETTGDQQVSVRGRIEIMLQKTAVLFRLAARVAIVLADVPSPAGPGLERYAFRYGLCFQLADDLEDLRGRAHLCRAPWQDLRDGVYTLPVLLALRVDASKGGRLSQMLRTIQERVDEDLVAGAAAVIAEYGVPDARATLGRWAASAKAALASVSSTESSTARRSLESLLATTLGQRGDHPASL